MAEEPKKFKPTVVRTVAQAQENVKVKKETAADKADKKQTGLLTNISETMKAQVAAGRKSMSRTAERAKAKMAMAQTLVLKDILAELREPAESGPLGLIILALQVAIGTLIGAVTKLFKVVKFFSRGLVRLLSRGFKKLFGVEFKKTRLGKTIRRAMLSIRMFFRNIGKGIRSGKGVLGFMGRLGKIFKSVFGFLGNISGATKFLTGALKFARFLGPIGIVITAVMSIIDGLKGWFKAAEWFDKKEGETATIGEKISAAIGGIISGLTFGLLGDGKAWATNIFKAFSDPIGFLTENVFGKDGILMKLYSKITDVIWWPVKMVGKLVDWVMGLMGVKTNVAGIIENIKQIPKDLFGGLMTAVQDIIDWFKDPEVPLWKKVLGAVFGWVQKVPVLIFLTIKNFFTKTETGKKIGAVITEWAGKVWNGIKMAVKNLFGIDLGEVVNSVTTWVTGVASKVWGTITGIFSKGWEFVKGLFDGEDVGPGIMATIGGSIKSVWDKIVGVFSQGWNFIKSLFTEEREVPVFQVVGDMIKSVWDKVVNIFAKGWGFIKGLFEAEEGEQSVAEKILTAVGGMFKWLWDTITMPFTKGWEFIKGIFKTDDESFVQTITDVIKSMLSAVWDTITGVLQKGKDLVKGLVGRAKKLGTDIGSGVASGIKKIKAGTFEARRARQVERLGLGTVTASALKSAPIIKREVEKEKQRLKEIKVMEPEKRAVVLQKGMTDVERLKVFMDWLGVDFVELMGNKIGKVMGKDVRTTSPSPVVIG